MAGSSSFSEAEKRRIRRQHRILANSEQRMKRVLGEELNDASASAAGEEDVRLEEAGNDDAKLQEMARELQELRKKELEGTNRGEGGGIRRQTAAGGEAGIFGRLLGADDSNPTATGNAPAEGPADPASAVINFLYDYFIWMVMGCVLAYMSVSGAAEADNAHLYVALAAVGLHVSRAMTEAGGGARQTLIYTMLPLFGFGQRAISVFRCIAYILWATTVYTFTHAAAKAVINAVAGPDKFDAAMPVTGHPPPPPPVDDELVHDF